MAKTYLSPEQKKLWLSFTDKPNSTSLPQASPILMDAISKQPFYPYEFDNRDTLADHIQSYIKTIDLILLLGEAEHTGDWDPYLYITFKDGTFIETTSGYSQIEILRQEHQYILVIHDYDEETDEEISHIKDIYSIESILLQR